MEQVAVSAAGAAMSAGRLTAHDSRAYTRVMRAVHWGTVGLLLCTYAAAWAIDNAPDPADRAWLTMLHRSFGILILLLTGIRLVIRQRTRIPPLPPGLPVPQRVAARLSAIALYVLLILQPLLGLTASALHGDQVVLFGDFVLPPVLQRDRTLAHALFQLHGATASLLLGLICLHAGAALYHHFVRKDHVLAAMLPMLSGRSGNVP